jgi:hypothetical protein
MKPSPPKISISTPGGEINPNSGKNFPVEILISDTNEQILKFIFRIEVD